MKGNFLHIGTAVLGFIFVIQGVNAQMIPDEDVHRLAQIYPEEVSQIDAEEVSGETTEVTTGNEGSRIRFSDVDRVTPAIKAAPSRQSFSAQLVSHEIHLFRENIQEELTVQRLRDQERRDQPIDRQNQRGQQDRQNQGGQQYRQNQNGEDQDRNQRDQQDRQNQQNQRDQQDRKNQNGEDQEWNQREQQDRKNQNKGDQDRNQQNRQNQQNQGDQQDRQNQRDQQDRQNQYGEDQEWNQRQQQNRQNEQDHPNRQNRQNQDRNQQNQDQWFDDDMNCPSIDSERCYFNNTQRKRCENLGGTFRNGQCFMDDNNSNTTREECEDMGGVYMNNRCYMEYQQNSLAPCTDQYLNQEGHCSRLDASMGGNESREEKARRKCEERGGEYSRGTCSIDYGDTENQSQNRNHRNFNSSSSTSLGAGIQNLVRTENRKKCENEGGEYTGNGMCVFTNYTQKTCDKKEGSWRNNECTLNVDDI